ncbi:MAG TPA: prepilin-type N-terminal cleavage/methylation domain-containing protein [Candidatus Rifleibacterium sp.]|nr:prepilin-type N-terminal cleavage/methylation domain-containing protein [Candidatus Rifleibacterium sp.]HPT45158.1 prepilin-type N-terminal cleavage/methylation domain-containing protein [Candidatus Rifleibacterium sp.]
MTRKSGFTLIEMSVSALIIALIVLTLIMVFRSNLATFAWGQKHMEFNQRIQLVMKQIFTDFKQINPILKQDENGHLYLQGEKIGDLFPNLITIYDKDKKPENGGEEVVFFLTSLRDLTRRDRVRYFLEKGELIRETQDYNGTLKRKAIAEKASDLQFTEDSGDIRQIHVKFLLADPTTPGKTEKIDFAVRLETDLVCVKTVKEYD